MEKLDGDDALITNEKGREASRDIVQFVPMRDFADKGFHALAREVRVDRNEPTRLNQGGGL